MQWGHVYSLCKRLDVTAACWAGSPAWRDRFGPLPGAAENALIAAAIRLEASKRRIPLVEVRGEKLMLTRGGSFILIGGRFPRLTGSDPDSRVREVLSVLEKMPNQ